MSYYPQNYGHQGSTAAGSGGDGLQFFPTQYGTPAFGGSMSPSQGGQSYSYGGDMTRDKLSTGFLAAFGSSGYPGEPPLLEGM
jgi:hypothetical protein